MRKGLFTTWALCCSMMLAVFGTHAQSTSQSFPTPVTLNEISGTIKARDIGDARLTSYFYGFSGTQGDIFINVVTKNFNGDIDVFAVDGLRSLTKIVVYADTAANETGRLIYLRKDEKLLLRVEGRSPNDDPATFRIKFAGSFVAAEGGPGTKAPEMPEIKNGNDSGIEVNSVGTIIKVTPKPTPAPKVKETIAKVEKPEKVDDERERPAEPSEKPAPESKKPIRVVISDNTATGKKIEPKKEVKKPVKPTPVKKKPEIDKTETESKTAAKKSKEIAPKEVPAPNPLENIRLVVLFKDGKKIERPMSEVIRFNVDKGVLTIVLKDGTLARHSILDVEKITIE